MKKLLCLVLFGVVFIFSTVARETVSEGSVMFLFGSNTEKTPEIDSKVSQVGVDISMMSFKDGKNFGFYMNTGYGFINKMKLTLNETGETATVDGEYIDFGMDLSLILGMGMQKMYNNFALAGGIGVAFDELSIRLKSSYGGTSMLNLGFGFGGEAGVKYYVSPKVYLTGAWAFQYLPLNYCMNNSGDFVENEANYFSSKFYLGVGFRTISITK